MKLKYFLFGFLSMIVLSVLGVFLFYKFYVKPKQEEHFAQIMESEQTSLEVSITTVPGKMLDSLDLRNLQNPEDKFQLKDKRFLFLNFWATWCKPCIAEMPELQTLMQNPEIKSLPVQFAFASNEEKEKIEKFIVSKNFQLPVYVYERGSLPERLGHKSIPVTFIIDTQTGIAYKAEGLRNWNSQFIIDFLKALSS